jgi:hypothetical protein
MTDNDPIEDEEANAELDRFQARDAAANGRDDDLILVLHHTFVKRSATTPKLNKADFTARFLQALASFDPDAGKNFPTTILHDLYREALDLLKGILDWNATLQALHSPEFVATQRYVETELQRVSELRHLGTATRHPGLSQSVASWEHRRLLKQQGQFENAARWLTKLAEVRTLRRSDIASSLLRLTAEALRTRLRGTAYARKRALLETALAIAVDIVPKNSADPWRAVTMRKHRAGTSAEQKRILLLLLAIMALPED